MHKNKLFSTHICNDYRQFLKKTCNCEHMYHHRCIQATTLAKQLCMTVVCYTSSAPQTTAGLSLHIVSFKPTISIIGYITAQHVDMLSYKCLP